MASHLTARIRALLIGLSFVAASDRVLVESQNALWISPEEQARLVDDLRSKVPAGWTLTPRDLGAIPDEWQSLDMRTFQIDGRNGTRTFRAWFLPPDWIGIRRPDPTRTQVVYWEGVLANAKYKSITIGEESIHQAVHAIGMNTPSLVNSGWREGIQRFRDRLDDIDAQTQALVRAFCATRACEDEAALSLIVLGVPARYLTRDCAEHATGRAQEFCASVLGYWGERESVPLLNALVASPTITAEVRRAAAFSLMHLADPSSGPALRQALQATASADDLSVGIIIGAIGRIRYAAAGPDLLTRLIAETERSQQARLAKTLADVRYLPAAAAIQRLCRTTAISSEWIVANTLHGDQDALPEMAMLRLTGPWGAPTDQIRVLVLPPDRLSVGGPIQVAALIENVGNRDLGTLRMTAGVWVIDGKDHPEIDRPKMDGNMSLEINGLDVRAVDLSPAISTPGTHSFRYRLLGATSNQVTLEFR